MKKREEVKIARLSPRVICALVQRDSPWFPDYDSLPEYANAQQWAKICRYRSPSRLHAYVRSGRIPTLEISAGGEQLYRVIHKDDMLYYLYGRVRGRVPIEGAVFVTRRAA